MKNIEDLLAMAKINALLDKREDEEVRKVCFVLAIIGAVAVIAAIAAAVYRYLAPDYLDDIEDEFEDDFFDDDDEEEEPAAEEKADDAE